MPKFKVRHKYKSHYAERDLVFEKGDVVELEAEVAAWVERDSPGTLRPYKPRRKRAVKAPPRNRMVTVAEIRTTKEPELITREVFGAVRKETD